MKTPFRKAKPDVDEPKPEKDGLVDQSRVSPMNTDDQAIKDAASGWPKQGWENSASEAVATMERAAKASPKSFYANHKHPRYAEFTKDGPTGNERVVAMLATVEDLRARLAAIKQ